MEMTELTDPREFPENLGAGPDEEFGVHPLRPVRRRRVLTVVAIGMLGIGTVLAYLLYSIYSDSPRSLSSSQGSGPLSLDTGVKLEDFRDFQQSASRAQRSTEQSLKAQQSEILRLSAQINLLSAKVDSLQRPAPAVEPTPSPPNRTSPARKRTTSPPRPSTSDISVGGAPLPSR